MIPTNHNIYTDANYSSLFCFLYILLFGESLLYYCLSYFCILLFYDILRFLLFEILIWNNIQFE